MQVLNTLTEYDPTAALQDFIECNQPLVILTGAGCSTESGIPEYRDHAGRWKHRQPVQYTKFVHQLETRKRYWSRSISGWPRIATALPNTTHYALAHLEQTGLTRYLITQNVDGLHQKAGSRALLELHGGLAWVICLECQFRIPRDEIQKILLQENPGHDRLVDIFAPDGDAIVETQDLSTFRVPACPKCRGILKPDVVFFGEQVPKSSIQLALAELDHARALLVIGSSLMVYSGYRFCKYVKAQNKSVAIINQGHTRADGEVDMKVELPSHMVLSELTTRLNQRHEQPASK